MKILVINHEKKTSDVVDTFMTVRQYAIINNCGFFKIEKVKNDYNLLDPFTGELLFTMRKA